MSHDGRESEIQAFLDDRMSDSERRAFEVRMANDPALARRVRELRTVSDALRGDVPELPPGFYTRLRSRFEAQHAPAPRWFRPLSWETAGLVTAVVLAGVLFAPFVMEWQMGRPESRVSSDSPAERKQEAAKLKERLDRNEDSDALEEDLAAEGRVAGMDSEEVGTVESEETEWAPSPRSEPADRRRDEPVESRVEARPMEKSKVADQFAPIRQAPAEPEPGKRERSGKKGAPSEPASPAPGAGNERAAMGEAADESLGRIQTFDDRVPPSLGIELPAGIIEPGTVIEIRSKEQWDRLFGLLGGDDQDALGEYDPSTRLVLIGPREPPTDCSRATWVPFPDRHEIRLAPEAGTAGSSGHGCAIRLPDDGLSIRVIEHEVSP